MKDIPVTTNSHEWARAICEELAGIKGIMSGILSEIQRQSSGAGLSNLDATDAPGSNGTGQVESCTKKQLIPFDFPGVTFLDAAGIEYIEDLPATKNELTAIHGVGPKTADQILNLLGEQSE